MSRTGIRAELLCRSNRGVTLTAAGKAFLHHGRLMLLHAQQLEDDLREYSKGIKGHVRVQANTSAVSEFLPRVLGSFLAARPDVSVDLVEQHSPAIVRAVTDEYAGGNRHRRWKHRNRLSSVTFPYREIDSSLSRLVSTSSPRKKKDATFRDTLNFNHVGLGDGSALFHFLTQKSQALNVPMNTRIRVGNFESLCRMVEANVGIGVIPHYVAARYSKHMDLRVVRLSDQWAQHRCQSAFAASRRCRCLPNGSWTLYCSTRQTPLTHPAATAAASAIRPPTRCRDDEHLIWSRRFPSLRLREESTAGLLMPATTMSASGGFFTNLRMAQIHVVRPCAATG